MTKNTTVLQKNKFVAFFESNYFFGLIGLITILCWKFEIPYLAYYFLVIISGILLLLHVKIYAILPLYFLQEAASRNHSGFQYQGIPFILLMVLCIGLLIIVFLDLLQNRKEYWAKMRKHALFWSVFAIFLSMIISWISSPVLSTSIEYTVKFGFNLVVILFGIFHLPKNEDSFRRLCISLIFVMLTVFCEDVLRVIELHQTYSLIDIFSHKKVDLGWSMSNHYIAIYNLAFCVCVYLFILSKRKLEKLIFMSLILLVACVDILSFCRGAYLGLIPCIPFAFVFYFMIAKNKRADWPYFLYVFFVFLIGFLVLYQQGVLSSFIEDIKNKGASLNGRGTIYDLAFKNWMSHFWIGTGAGSSHYYILQDLHINIVNYHNAFLQITTCGIIGMICFVLYLLQIILRLFSKKPIILCLFMMFLYCFFHGMCDTIFFHRAIMPVLNLFLCFLPTVYYGKSKRFRICAE